jgi:hypothetical protein
MSGLDLRELLRRWGLAGCIAVNVATRRRLSRVQGMPWVQLEAQCSSPPRYPVQKRLLPGHYRLLAPLSRRRSRCCSARKTLTASSIWAIDSTKSGKYTRWPAVPRITSRAS